MLLTFASVDEIPWGKCKIQIKPFHHYGTLYVVLAFETVHEILWCDDSSENSFPLQVYINMLLLIIFHM